MEEQQTLVLIKPDGMEHIEEIIEILYNNGLKIDEFKVMQLDNEIISEHYAHVMDRPFFPALKDFMTSAPIAAMILSGENAVAKVRTVIGCTNSKEAAEGTVRNLYGTDSTKNAIHASDSVENAQIEINRFFRREPAKKLVPTNN